MLESVLKNKDVFSDCLHSIKRYDLMLNAEEIQHAEDITAVLKQSSVATDFFQGQKYPTLNSVLIFLTDIKSSLRTNLKDSSEVIRKASKILLTDIDKRFPVTETQVIAAFLDPSMQKLAEINIYLNEKQQSMTDMLENVSRSVTFWKQKKKMDCLQKLLVTRNPSMNLWRIRICGGDNIIWNIHNWPF